MIWLRIKGNAFPDVSKVFKVRQDNGHKGWIDWGIASIPPKYMTDVWSDGTEYDFTKHMEHEWGAKGAGTGNESVREDGMDKRSAMEMVNEHLGNRLLYGRNTSFANINAAVPLWWMNIGPSKFKSDLHLLLAKEGDGGLIWLRIKGNAFPDVSKVFSVRQDNSHKGLIDLGISSIPPKYMTDVKGGGTEYDFTKHIEHEWGRPLLPVEGTQ